MRINQESIERISHKLAIAKRLGMNTNLLFTNKTTPEEAQRLEQSLDQYIIQNQVHSAPYGRGLLDRKTKVGRIAPYSSAIGGYLPNAPMSVQSYVPTKSEETVESIENLSDLTPSQRLEKFLDQPHIREYEQYDPVSPPPEPSLFERIGESIENVGDYWTSIWDRMTSPRKRARAVGKIRRARQDIKEGKRSRVRE